MVTKGSGISEAKQKIFVSLAVLAIVSIAIYNLVVSPQTALLVAAQDYERIAKNTERKIDVLTRSINRMRGEVVRMEEFDAAAVGRFFDIGSGLRFLDNLESEITESGCSIVSLNYMLPEPVEIDGFSCDKLEVISKNAEIKVLGNYSNIAGLLERLSRHSERVSVGDLAIATTDDQMAIRCNMKITVYIIEDKELISNVEN